MKKFIDLGTYIEIAINYLQETFTPIWDAMDDGISWTVSSMNDFLIAIPFVVTLVVITFFAYYAKAGKKSFKLEGLKKGAGLAVFVIFGFFLIYGMGYWKEAIQTTTLVLVSTFWAFHSEYLLLKTN